MNTLPLKKIPDPILDAHSLAPPNLKDYSYFDASQVAPFQPQAIGFDPTNATWLADAALLAYAPPEFAKTQLQRASVALGASFSGLSTQAYVAIADSYVIVAFRGTEVRDLKDFLIDAVLADADFAPSPSVQGGNVHRGFQRALEEIWAPAGRDGLFPFLQSAINGPKGQRMCWFTGHSLGAALATLAAGRFAAENGSDPSASRLYTYASPRVGDLTFANDYPISGVCRFVNNNDAVPRLPPPNLGFKHVGEPLLIDRRGAVAPATTSLRAPGDTLHGTAIDLIGAMKLNFIDHAPIYYATHLWNAFASRS